jgi:hypothetical protein
MQSSLARTTPSISLLSHRATRARRRPNCARHCAAALPHHRTLLKLHLDVIDALHHTLAELDATLRKALAPLYSYRPMTLSDIENSVRGQGIILTQLK